MLQPGSTRLFGFNSIMARRNPRHNAAESISISLARYPQSAVYIVLNGHSHECPEALGWVGRWGSNRYNKGVFRGRISPTEWCRQSGNHKVNQPSLRCKPTRKSPSPKIFVWNRTVYASGTVTVRLLPCDCLSNFVRASFVLPRRTYQ